MYTQLSNNIKEYRKKAKLTQKQLAEKIGVSQQTVAYYENGKQNIKYSTVKQIATALNINSSDLYEHINMGSYLRYARIKKKLTKQQLGELIGVSSDLINEWEESYSLDDSIINKFQDILGNSNFLDKVGETGYDNLFKRGDIEYDSTYLDILDPDKSNVEKSVKGKKIEFNMLDSSLSYDYIFEIDSNGNMCYFDNKSNIRIKTDNETVIFRYKREFANNDKHTFEIYSGSIKLNKLGRSKAIERIIELSQIPKYQADNEK